MLFLLAAASAQEDPQNPDISHDYSDPSGALQDSSFAHKKCFDTFGDPVGLEIASGVRISMVESFSWERRAHLGITAATSAQLDSLDVPANCFTSGAIPTATALDLPFYNLSACGGTPTARTTICAKICTTVASCVAFELGPELTLCSLHGGADFEIPGNLPKQCQQYPMEYHYSQTCSQRVQPGGFMGTICPDSPVDPRKYRDKSLPQQRTQAMPPNFYRIGVWTKIYYYGMTDADDILEFCASMRTPASKVLASLSEFNGKTTAIHIECGAATFDASPGNGVVPGTFVFWISAPEAHVIALQDLLEASDCDGPTACDAISWLTDFEAGMNGELDKTDVEVRFVSETFREIDKSWTISPDDVYSYEECFDAAGHSKGMEIAPGWTAVTKVIHQLLPESHQAPPILYWSDFEVEHDFTPVPRGCFPDTTDKGTPSNPAARNGGSYVKLNGPDCVGNRTETEMFRICMTICARIDYGGVGSIDDRCIGANYDEHGWGGHCHLQRSRNVLAYDSPTCEAQGPAAVDALGTCGSKPGMTPRASCSALGFEAFSPSPSRDVGGMAYDWCGTINTLMFFCWYVGGNGQMPGPHNGRDCLKGAAWDDDVKACTPCPKNHYSVAKQDANLNLAAPRPLDSPSVINVCEPCPPNRACPPGTGCSYFDDPATCPEPIDCKPGTFWDVDAIACLPCEADTYKSAGGNATSCTKCPDFSSTNNALQSASASNCTCEFGFVGTITDENSICFKCPADATEVDEDGHVVEACSGGELMRVPTGFYKPVTTSPTTRPEEGYGTFDIHSCRHRSNCDQTVLNVASATECVDGSTGPFCGSCKDGWIIYKDGHCEACDATSGVIRVSEIIGMGIFFACIVGFETFVAYLAAGTKYVSRRSSQRASISHNVAKVRRSPSDVTDNTAPSVTFHTIENTAPGVSTQNEVGAPGGLAGVRSRPSTEEEVEEVEVKPRLSRMKSPDWAKAYQAWLGNTPGLEEYKPTPREKMPVTSMSIKGCYDEIRGCKDVGVFSPVLRIFMNYSQITGLLRFVSSREFDESVGGKIMRSFSFLHFFSFTFVVDVFETLDCGIGTTVWGKTTIVAMMPVILMVIMTIAILAFRACISNVGLKEWVRSCCFGSMIMYTAVISGVLSNLTPTEEVNGKRYLQRDTSIEFDAAGGVQAFSVCYAAVFGLGFPCLLLFFYHSGLNKKKTDDDQKYTRLKYGFIAKGYSKDFFWWELLVLIRRIACILAVVTTNDPATQTTFVLLIIFCYTVLHLKNAPYAHGFLNMYELLNLLCLQFGVFAQSVAYGSPTNTMLTSLAVTVFLTCQIVFIAATIGIYYCLAGVIRAKMAAWAATSNSLPAFFMKLFGAAGMSSL